MIKKIIPLIILIGSMNTLFGQFTTGTYSLWTNTTIRIDTTPTDVTLTLVGSSDKWLGVGFGMQNYTMDTVTDMFIWSDTPERDYTPVTVGNSGHNIPVPDTDQSWTIVSDNVASGIRTIVATRSLVSTGDFTFSNSTSAIQVIFAEGITTTLAYHGANEHTGASISRFFWLALEDFSEDAPSFYPNPTNCNFIIKTKKSIDKITIYSQTGAVVKIINLEIPKEENEVNVSDLSTGMYVVELQSGNQKSYKNLMLK